MKDQRGSVTVIAVVMLLFLMIIAVAWLPMLTTEKTAAASDYREQQAWYAAEAGYKRAVAELEAGKSNVLDWLSSGDDLEKGTFDEKNILEIQETQTKAVESSAIWYAVAIDGISKDKTYSPEAGKTYAITSVGSCQGIRKDIRKDFILGEDDETNIDEGKYLEQSLIYAGNKVNVKGGNQSVSIEGGHIISHKITGNDKWQGNTTIHEVTNSELNKFLADMRTKIKNSVFNIDSYPTLEVITPDNSLNIPEGKSYYFKNNNVKGDIVGSYGSVLFIESDEKDYELSSWGSIKGPVIKSGKNQPFTIIYKGPKDGDLNLKTIISGGIKVISNVNIVFEKSSQYSNGLAMFLSNGNVIINCNLSKVFISADNDVHLEEGSGLTGQIQAWNEVTLQKLGNTLKFDDTVLGTYGFPKELEAHKS